MTNKVLCKLCQDEGLKSTVTMRGQSSTLVGHSPYYDEEGNYHSHDPNWITCGFSCSHGHYWSVSSVTACPADGCSYGQEL